MIVNGQEFLANAVELRIIDSMRFRCNLAFALTFYFPLLKLLLREDPGQPNYTPGVNGMDFKS
jgi:hypothetical protein